MKLHTGRPFWPISDGLPAVYPTLTSSIDAEFVILGGGITGAILAHRLASAGRDVVVIDRKEVASGSTSATTALIQHELDVPAVQVARRVGDELTNEIHSATRRAVLDFVNLGRQLCVAMTNRAASSDAGGNASRMLPPTVQQRPTIKLASGKRDVRGLHADFTYRQKAGFEVAWLSSEDLTTGYGMTRPGAIQSPDSAECDPYAMTHVLLDEAIRLGARVYDRVPVRDVLLGNDWGDDVIVTTDLGHVVRARTVVAATGYESTQWLRRPAALRNTYVTISEPIPEWKDGPWPNRSLVWETSHPYLYLRTTPDCRVIVGGEDDRFRTPIARDRRIDRKVERLLQKVTELMPHLALEPAYSWAGTFGETPDALPRIGTVDGRPNLFVAACYGGNGITFAMLAAEMLEARMNSYAHPLAECVRPDR